MKTISKPYFYTQKKNTMMLQTVCLLVCSLVFLNPTFIKSDPLGCYYQNSTLYSPNSTSGRIYRNNLDILLSVLTTNASRPNGFYSFSTGGAANSSNGTTVYGLFLCRGDVGTSDCEDCIKTASSEVLRFCPNGNEALIWYDSCMLRYSNRSIFNTAEDGFGLTLININNATDKDSFGRVLTSTLDEVISNAVKDDISSQKLSVAEDNILTKKFAVGQNSVPSMKMTVASGNDSTVPVLPRIYTLAQCTPDISSLDCRTCLESIVQDLPDYYPVGARVIVPSCNIRYETYLFFNVSSAPLSPQPSLVPPPTPLSPQPSLVPPPTPLSPQPSGKGVSTRMVMVIVFSIASCTMLLIICSLVLRKRSKKRHSADRRKSKSGGDDITIDPESLQYSLSDIETATNNFSAENKIGQGGFGIVYKGKLPHGQEIAVKRLSKRSGQGAEEFKNEISVVAKLQHRNLVQLLGFCLEGEEKILVFEFVPRRSLDYFLFDPKKQGLLNWSRRRNIIGGIARGLLYLHEDSRLKIVHRDLKAGNILLDESMHPKIADFGMAKICGIHESEGNTTRIAGTFGYMAPEYTRSGHYSVKSDVFSFGVVILEILTGKKNSAFYHSADSENLITYAWRQWRNSTPLALLDPTIGESYVKTEVIQCVHIGLLCVEEDANKRPTMALVVSMLNSASVSLPTPHCPAVLEGSLSGNRQEELELANVSINKASITEPYPR